ncbi:ABC transporter ATP-binding protein [Sneathiella chinensis]|uniref:Multidrug ABC transporter ATP-binding protein n=1 Tax=Sneathiella chinensis TaxID=349750 RepID=A0ABQ5U0I3_9PROT|nr:ABC transporter ATP-binding protein [Sneathiella chinensis]GLQ05180.1 multidrug ABC transporter ATP-binding protein [Sneathiella chinensis]
MNASALASASPANALEVRDLRKIYKGKGSVPDKEALKGISLDVPRGSFFGLLGPNGAGKSTLINILAGLVNKTSGTARVCGYDIQAQMRQARLSLGVVPQELNLDAFFSAREVMEFQAGLYGVPKAKRRTAEILEAMGLTDKADSYARTLSGGMRRRLLVAKAMVHQPDVLILDEPTAGVDIELRQQLWEYIRELNARGTTIILTTHYLEEAEELCDQIAIINHGEVVACEPTETLLGKLDSKTISLILDREIDAVPAELEKFNATLSHGRKLSICYKPSEVEISKILAAVAESGLGIADLSTEEPDLEDAFLQMTSSKAKG